MPQRNSYRHDDPKPGPDDPKGFKIWIKFKDGNKRSQHIYGQKRPPADLKLLGPLFCDEYAYRRCTYLMSTKYRGLWDKIVIIHRETNEQVEYHFMENGFHHFKTKRNFQFVQIPGKNFRYRAVLQ